MNDRMRKALAAHRGFRKLQAEEIFLKSHFEHVEAYCLMLYVGRDPVSCQETEEVIWNSRDGVTPFVVHHRCGWGMQHENWREDICCPLHVPMVGDRVFVDMTEERATQIATRRVESGWSEDCGGYRMSDTFDSREDAVKKLVSQFLGTPDVHGTPDVLVVDDALQLRFINRRVAALGALDRHIRVDERLAEGT